MARLAGVPRDGDRAGQGDPRPVGRRAPGRRRPRQDRPAAAGRDKQAHIQLTLFGAAEHPLRWTSCGLDLNNLTPLAALQILQRWQEEVAREGKQ